MNPHVYLDDKLVESMDNFIKENNYKSRSEMISRAIEFFIDYNHNKKAGDFLAREVEAIMSGNLELVEKRLGNRFGKLLSDIAIQLGMLEQIMQSASDLSKDEISTYRKIAVDGIRNNQRIFRYEDLVK